MEPAHRVPPLQRSSIMDATRLSDGQIVTIKKVKKSQTPLEESTIRLFSTVPLTSDPHNHAIPLYDVLHSPLDANVTLLVMPYLSTVHDYKFTTVGEAVECFRQIFEVSRMFCVGLTIRRPKVCRVCSLSITTLLLIGEIDRPLCLH